MGATVGGTDGVAVNGIVRAAWKARGRAASITWCRRGGARGDGRGWCLSWWGLVGVDLVAHLLTVYFRRWKGDWARFLVGFRVDKGAERLLVTGGAGEGATEGRPEQKHQVKR